MCVKASAESTWLCFEGFVFKAPSPFFWFFDDESGFWFTNLCGDDDIAEVATADMRFWSCLQSIVVLAAALGSASPTPQTADSETGVATSSGSGTMSAADAAKQELQQAAMLLASMPACGVSSIEGCYSIFDDSLTVIHSATASQAQ